MVSFKTIKSALSPRGQNANEIQIVVVKPNVLQAVGLGVLVLYNITMLVLGVTVAHGAWWTREIEMFAGSTSRLYFLYSTVPFVATICSVAEFVLGWHGRLKRLQVLITAPIFFILYVLYCITTSNKQFCAADQYNIDSSLACAYTIAGVDTWRRFGNYTGRVAYNIGWAAIPAATLYLLYFVWAVFCMQPGRKTPNVAVPKPVNDAESAYSFSTMPVSNGYYNATMPPSRVTSPTPPSYHHHAGPSLEVNRISDATSYGGVREMKA